MFIVANPTAATALLVMYITSVGSTRDESLKGPAPMPMKAHNSNDAPFLPLTTSRPHHVPVGQRQRTPRVPSDRVSTSHRVADGPLAPHAARNNNNNNNNNNRTPTQDSLFDFRYSKNQGKQQQTNSKQQSPKSSVQHPTPRAQSYGQPAASTLIGGSYQRAPIGGSSGGGAEFDVPLLVATGNNLASANPIVESQMFDHQHPLALQSNGQEQIVNSFYVSGFGTQPMNAQVLNTQGVNIAGGLNQYSQPTDYASNGVQQNYYNPDQGPYVTYDGGGQMGGRGADYRAQTDTGGSNQDDDQARRGPDRGERDDRVESDTSEPRKQKAMLTNDQLMSLIDELKEFNSKEASKMTNSAVQPNEKSGGEQTANDGGDGDNEAGGLPAKKIETSVEARKFEDDDPHKGDDDSGGGGGGGGDGGGSVSLNKLNDDDKDFKDDDDKAKNDDLAKFARFLLTKEGANMRFQLGLDKDHLDDGEVDEDDDKDQLLESKARPTSKDLRDDRGNKKQLDVQAQLNKFVDDVARMQMASARAKANNKRAGKVPHQEKEDSYGEPKDMDSDMSDRARRRRDQGTMSDRIANSAIIESRIDNAAETKPINRSGMGRGREDNFAKLLIKSELMDDKLESAQDKSSGAKRLALSSTPVARIAAKPNQPKMLKNSHMEEGELDMTPKRGEKGQRKEKYPKDERHEDRAAMMDKIQRAREARVKLRTRIPITLNPIVKRALDGDVSMKVEHNSEGDLLLRNSKDGVMKFKLPKKHKGAKKSKTPQVALDNSAPIPVQTEPDKSHRSSGQGVRMQSERPLEDEYPISERVSDRLNKLSHNLDRYFNDGFLQEIESKSKLQDAKDKENEGDGNHAETTSSNNKRSPTIKPVNDRPKGKFTPNKDHDFDINVNVDGKRESDKDEDDLDKRIDSDKEDEDEDDGEASGQNLEKTKLRQSSSNSKKSSHRGKAPKKGKTNTVSKNPKRDNITSSTKKVKAVERPNKRSEDLEFENLGKLIDNMDPVENETLETPIGPDNYGSTEPPANSADQSSNKNHKDKNETMNYGKKTSFYQEPD